MIQQLLPIHLAAYILLPENQGVVLTPTFMKEADNFILQKAGQCGFYQWY